MKIRPLASNIATLYFAAEKDGGGTAVLDAPETKEQVTAPGQTSLAQVFKDTLKKQQATIAQPDPNVKKEPAVKAEPEAKKEGETKAEPEAKTAEVKKPASPLDAVLEKPVEAKAEPASDDPAPNAQAKQLREAYERQKAEAIKWKGEAEKASKGDPAVSQKLAALQEERDKLAARNAELTDAVTALNVDYDPEVRRKYHDGKAALVEKTVDAVEQFGGDKKKFIDAMDMKPGKARTVAIREALEEVDEIDRTAIYNKLSKVSELEEEHAELLKNSQKSYSELTKKQQERIARQQEETENAKVDVFNKAAKALPNTHPTIREVPETVEGHEEWNARIKADHAAGLRLLGPDATLEEISAAAVKGARYDFVEGLLLEERKTSAELRERIAKYESAEPGFNGRTKTDTTSKLDKTPGQIWHEEMEKKRNKGD